MTSTIPMPKLIESKQDLESLIPGEQIYFHIGFRQAWAVYEGIIDNKIAFMIRSEIKNEVISYRIISENIKIRKEDSSIRVKHNLGNLQIIKYSPIEAFPQKLKMLRGAGL